MKKNKKKQSIVKKHKKINWVRIIALILCILTVLGTFIGVISYTFF